MLTVGCLRAVKFLDVRGLLICGQRSNGGRFKVFVYIIYTYCFLSINSSTYISLTSKGTACSQVMTGCAACSLTAGKLLGLASRMDDPIVVGICPVPRTGPRTLLDLCGTCAVVTVYNYYANLMRDQRPNPFGGKNKHV